MSKRGEEIRRLNALTAEQLKEKAGDRLVVVADLDALHGHFARSMADEVKANNAAGRRTRIILPYGPYPHYPTFARIVNTERISLKNAFFFFMDDYCDENGVEIPAEHPLSFRGAMERIWEMIDEDLRIPAGQVVFPLSSNIARLAGMIRQDGGIDTCYGGVGIPGHVAFNDPEPGVADTSVRMVRFNDTTVCINCIRSKVGGDLVNFPHHALTIGMKEVLSAERLRFYIRSTDVAGIDWANTVLRLTLFGVPGDDYPVTHIRNHPDYVIHTDAFTAAQPAILL